MESWTHVCDLLSKSIKNEDWACLNLTDSGLRVKNPSNPHEDRVKQTGRRKASYTDQYKREALELWRRSGRSAAKVGAELGIRPPLLYRWAQLEREPEVTKSKGKSRRSIEELEAENRHLRAENAKLLEQREVLKKSLGILSEVPPSGMPGSNK